MNFDIASRARSGAKVLALRNAATQVLRVASSVVVARWLSPEDFGLFAVLIYISGLPLYIQNLGLSGALIQKHEEPSEEQWSSAFFLQLSVALIIFLFIAIAGPWLLHLFGAPASAHALLVVAAIPSVLAAFGFYQTVWLQRHMQFQKFASATFVGDVVSVVLLCVMATAGFGVWTLVLAPAVSAATQTSVLLALHPWRPRLVCKLSLLRPLLAVGAPMQVNVTLPMALDGWIPFYTSRMLGAEPLGLLNLAQRLAAIPSSYLQILNQVALPSFSRMQDDASDVVHRLGNVLHRVAVLSACGYMLAVAWVPDVVDLVYGARWRSSGHLLQYLGISIVLIAMASVVGPALNALGRHWLRTIPMLVAYVFAWGAAPSLIRTMGADGLGLAIVGFASALLVGMALCLPKSVEGRGKVVRIVLGSAAVGLVFAIALPHLTALPTAAKIAVSATGCLLAAAITLVESRCSQQTTFLWACRLLMPQS